MLWERQQWPNSAFWYYSVQQRLYKPAIDAAPVTMAAAPIFLFLFTAWFHFYFIIVIIYNININLSTLPTVALNNPISNCPDTLVTYTHNLSKTCL